MDPKLTTLFLLIATIIGLSNFNDGDLGRLRRQISPRRWRELVQRRRK